MEKEIGISASELRIQLQNELSRRCRVNSRYSVRAFAKHLQIDPSSLSQILSGKRNISKKMVQRICEQTGWSKAETTPSLNPMDQDAFAALADWYHFAILELTQLEGFNEDPHWIARKLSITPVEARTALDRLVRLGCLEKRETKFYKTSVNLEKDSTGPVRSAHKEYQRQILQKALAAIDIESRDQSLTTSTVATHSSKIPEARERIQAFHKQLSEFLEAGEKDTVVQLAVQLFPLIAAEN